MTDVKSDWCSKWKENNNEALLSIKVKVSKLKSSLKSILMMQQCFDGMRMNGEKEGIGREKKKHKKRSRKTRQLRFTNEFIDFFLENSRDEGEGNVI